MWAALISPETSRLGLQWAALMLPLQNGHLSVHVWVQNEPPQDVPEWCAILASGSKGTPVPPFNSLEELGSGTLHIIRDYFISDSP